jgi:hypothetical protein
VPVFSLAFLVPDLTPASPLRNSYGSLTPVWVAFAQTGVMANSIIEYAIYIVSAVFLLGLAGSAVVVLISFVEDFFELFSDDETSEIAHSRPPIN